MVVDGHFLGLPAHAARHLGGQGGIEPPLQLRQVLHAHLLIEIAPNRVGIGRADQVGTDRLQGALGGRHPQQHLEQIVRGAFISLRVQRQISSSRFWV